MTTTDKALSCAGAACIEPRACFSLGFCLFDRPELVISKVTPDDFKTKGDDTCLHCALVKVIDQWLAQHRRPADYVITKIMEAAALATVGAACHTQIPMGEAIDYANESFHASLRRIGQGSGPHRD